MNKKEHKLAYVAPEPIRLLDHSEETFIVEEQGQENGYNHEQNHEQNHICISSKTSQTHQYEVNWATDCRFGECTIVKGTSSQRFAVWALEIQTTSHNTVKLFKRYSDFVQLRRELIIRFPDKIGSIPQLPPKKAFGNLQNDFLLKRRKGLEYFLSCVVLNPVLANSEPVRRFATVK